MISKQEMFNRAYRGLASQGFERCRSPEDSGCVYASEDGTKHCAWGWVDTSLDHTMSAWISSLQARKIGVAADLDEEHLQFATELQQAHDNSPAPDMMLKALQQLACEYSLTIPEVTK